MNAERFVLFHVLRGAVFAALVATSVPVAAHAAVQEQAAPAQAAEDPAATVADAELPFSKLPYSEARAAAAAQSRLFIVDATATWCAPCKWMEREAWPDAEVTAWLAKHAIAVQVDVDAQKDVALELKIDAMPTMIVFRGELEIGRTVGKLDAGELRKWLDDVAVGRVDNLLVARGRELLASDDVDARWEIARALLQQREDELALKHYLWLWHGTRSVKKFFGVRASYMLLDMKNLAARDDDAAEAVARLFEEIRGKVTDTDAPEGMDWVEFTAWCRVFGHEDQPLDWYERHRAPDGSVRLDLLGRWSLFETLVAAGRWADAGRVGELAAMSEQRLKSYRDYRALMRSDADSSASALRKAMMDEQAELARFFAQFAAGAWAAEREAEGREFARQLLAEVDDATARLVLVDITLHAVGARPEQSVWLEEAAASGGDAAFIARLRKTLRKHLEAQAAGKPLPLTEPAR